MSTMSARDVLDSPIFGDESSASRLDEFFSTLRESSLVPTFRLDTLHPQSTEGQVADRFYATMSHGQGNRTYIVAIVPSDRLDITIYRDLLDDSEPRRVALFREGTDVWTPDDSAHLVGVVVALYRRGLSRHRYGSDIGVRLRDIVTVIAAQQNDLRTP